MLLQGLCAKPLSPRGRGVGVRGEAKAICEKPQSRSNSLIEVFDRVCSSTRFTITAQ